MKKAFLTLMVVSALMVSVQSFASVMPLRTSLSKVFGPWLTGYNGRITTGYGNRVYINASYPGTITSMVIENSDGSFTGVLSWTSPTTVDPYLGGYRYTGRIYYLTPANEVAFMAMSDHIELALID